MIQPCGSAVLLQARYCQDLAEIFEQGLIDKARFCSTGSENLHAKEDFRPQNTLLEALTHVNRHAATDLFCR